MRISVQPRVVALAVVTLAAGCDQLGLGHKAVESQDLPSPEALAKIGYMTTAASGPEGRKVYTRLEEARSCGDFELAMRWNRPPDVAGGPFHQKLIFLTKSIPADLPKNSEVFIVGVIERGGTLASGAGGWSLRMQDGSQAQAIETAGLWEKQEQAAQDGGVTAIVDPETPGRLLCAHGIYQGVVGKASGQSADIPLVSVLFAMDRDQNPGKDTGKRRGKRHGK